MKPITFATLARLQAGGPSGEMVATVKLIPFGVEAKTARRRGGRGQRRGAQEDRALCDQARRHRLDIAAGAGAEGGGQNLAGDGGNAWRPPAPPSWPSGGCRMIEAALKAAIKELPGSAAEW